MSRNSPSPYAMLNQRIAQLELKQRAHEQALHTKTQDLLKSVRPSGIVRDAVQEMVEDRDLQLSAAQAALKVGSRFLVFKVLKRFGGIYGAVAAAVAGSISDKYVTEATPKVFGSIGNWMKKVRAPKTGSSGKSDSNPHMYI